MQRNFIKNCLLFIFLFLLWAPLLQNTLHVFYTEPLKGAYHAKDDITFNFKDWFATKYTTTKEEYLKTTFGFMADLVRLNKQVNFSLFNKTNENEIMGKDYYLYEPIYTNAYYGIDFVGDNNIIERVKKAKQVQDTFQSMGKFFYIVFAPGKASFYPEYLDSLANPSKPTNYKSYIKYCNQYGVNYIDFHLLFDSLKYSSPYPLYARGGVHWSYYGELLVFDSIVKYVEQNIHKDLPNIAIQSIELSTSPKYRDNDAADALNLIYYPKKDTLAYPIFTANDTNKYKPVLLNIGDSYFDGMFGFNMANKSFSAIYFWYYFYDLFPLGRPTIKNGEADFKQIIDNVEVISIVQTDGQLSNLGSGFIEVAHQKYCK